MYCGECGTKNKKGDLFCSECGAKLEQSDSVESEQQEVIQVEKKPRQPMSKKNKLIITLVIVFVVIIGIGYKVGSDMTSPKKVAKEYIKAVIDQDADKLYGYLNFDGDDTFATKKMFSNLLKEEAESESDIENYTITDVEYADGKLSATVDFKYTLKGSSSEQSSSVKLTKQKNKKYLFFDNWKVTGITDSMLIKDYTIKVAKGSKLTYSGVKVDSKYLDKNESTDEQDVYILPYVFATETEVKAVLPSGLEVNDKVTPSSYYSNYTVSFNSDSLSKDDQKQLLSDVKENINTIYQNAILKKSFADIKSTYERKGLDLKNIEEAYTAFVSNLNDNSNVLKAITFEDPTLYYLSLTEDGYLEVEVRIDYDYTIDVKKWNDEIETRENSSYGYMTLVMGYDKGSYYLASFDEDDLDDYFYSF